MLATIKVPERAASWLLVTARTHILGLLALAAVTACDGNQSASVSFDGVVKVGILHSRTGTMAISENTVAEAELMAIEEINNTGGITIQGEKLAILPVEEDGASNWSTFSTKAEQLINYEQVSVVFGGWTSASRKAMLPVFEREDHLLFYPIQYEGQECSKNIFYAGATPNQQAEPGVRWLLENKGKDFFLVGSDYIYPRTVNEIIAAQLALLGGQVVGERYIPLESTNVAPIIDAIRQALPEGGNVINTINGESNLEFFKQAREAGITPENGFAIMSFSIAEEEISAIGSRYLEGTYATWSYFQSLESPASAKFTSDFKRMHGLHRVTSDPAAAAYTMVHLWAEAAEKADSVDPRMVRESLIGVGFDAPQGRVEVQPNHHLAKLVLIGEVQSNGMFKIVLNAGVVNPSPWSNFLSESRGYICDWTTDRPDAGKFRLP